MHPTTAGGCSRNSAVGVGLPVAPSLVATSMARFLQATSRRRGISALGAGRVARLVVMTLILINLLTPPGHAGTPGLVAAAARGDIETVARLLEAGADPSDALDDAARAGHAEVVRMLLEAGRPVKFYEGSLRLLSALQDAASAGHDQAVHVLLEAGAGPSFHALDDAVEAGDIGMSRMLLEAGAAPSPRAMDFAAGAGNVEILRMLLHAGANPSDGLFSATANGEAEIVESLLRSGGDPNDARRIYRGRLDLTPLHMAAMTGRLEIAATLVRAGADTEARTRYRPPGTGETVLAAFISAFTMYLADFEGLMGIEMKDMHGWTPLEFATAAGHSAMIDVLTEASSAPE